MKKIYLTFCITFISLLLFAQNSDYFYYYKGKKQYLELNKDYVFIQTTGKDVLQKSKTVKNSNNVKLQKYGASNQLGNTMGKRAELYWAEIKLTKNKGKNYKEQIAMLKKDKNIEVVAPYFKSKSDDKIGLSNFFYVKIKHLKDTTTLKSFSDKHRTLIVKQDKFMPLWFLMSCTKATNKNALEMANLYYESKLFKYAEPDLMVDDIYTCANDPFFPNQWGLKNTGQNGGTAGVDIKVCDAWKISKGKNITVAVIDQGIELDHPDLQANIHPLSYDTENGTSPSIIRGSHGTACAGIVGAVDNNIGISGVAPDCQLMSISDDLFLSPSTKQRLANGINWAAQNGADVLSNSWGHNDLSSSLIDDAITNALTNGRNGLGCVVVFATGNDNSSVTYPANSNPNILTVGAISPCGKRKSFSSCDSETSWGSNYGSQLDIVAPGVLIPTTDIQGNGGYNSNKPLHIWAGGNKLSSDYSNRDYTVWFNGTSSACPHVAGVAALMLSVRPNLTGQQVRDVIEQTAQKVGGYSYTTHSNRPNGRWNNQMGYGLVDAYAAVYAIAPRIVGSNTICNQETYTIENLPPGATVHWSVNTPYLQVSTSGVVSKVNDQAEGGAVITAHITTASGDSFSISKNVQYISKYIDGYFKINYTQKDFFATNYQMQSRYAETGVSGGESINIQLTKPSSNMTSSCQMNWEFLQKPSCVTGHSILSDYNMIIGTSRPSNTEIIQIKVSVNCAPEVYAILTIYVNNFGPYTYRISEGLLIIENEDDAYLKGLGVKKVKREKREIQQVQLYSLQANKVIDITASKFRKQFSVEIPVGHLPSGFYVLRVYDGKQWYKKKIWLK